MVARLSLCLLLLLLPSAAHTACAELPACADQRLVLANSCLQHNTAHAETRGCEHDGLQQGAITAEARSGRWSQAWPRAALLSGLAGQARPPVCACRRARPAQERWVWTEGCGLVRSLCVSRSVALSTSPSLAKLAQKDQSGPVHTCVPLCAGGRQSATLHKRLPHDSALWLRL